MFLKSAFGVLINLKGGNWIVYKPDTTPGTVTVKVAQANSFTAPDGPASTVSTGKEYVCMYDPVVAILGRDLKRGDRFVKGTSIMTVDKVKPLEELGGTVIGFRFWSQS